MPQHSNHTHRRRAYIVSGQVQGVGFRPFVYRIACERSLAGAVRNTPEGVRIEVQGPEEQVKGIAHDLSDKAPPLAQIVAVVVEELELVEGDTEFSIEMSAPGQGHNVLISPDTATCPDCLKEMWDADDRRHLYPFTNCTNCGPRYTITRSIPYDRDKTSMACFPLCEECAAEYNDPLDRRFHAQPNACAVCGPRLWLTQGGEESIAQGLDALRGTAKRLVNGELGAVKGLGGFHLACLAGGKTGAEAVARLRERKNRKDKPLALMVPDLETARRLAEVGEAEETLMSGTVRPIVLCRKKADNPGRLSKDLAADTEFLGIMLPYTPLHHVLLRFVAEELNAGGAEHAQTPPALVMTSGNMSSEPISLGNREALQRLGGIADFFLFHNRDILIRTDDSVVRPIPASEPGAPTQTQFFRRARGYAPAPIFLAETAPPVLGLGPELKNTLCLTKGNQAFVSQHIGDMENLETFGFYREIATHLQNIMQTAPEALIRDLHPDYLTTQYAQEQNELPVLTLQHHYAHAHAVLAENKHEGPAIALALDGTGYGEDGTLWGGECLFVDSQLLTHQRLAYFSPMVLPGGESAIREPWRIAQACLWALGVKEPQARPWPWLEQYDQASGFLPQILEKGLNCPVSTSCGRLFDAVSAMLGLKMAITYEGQAAIALEQAQDMSETQAYACLTETVRDPAVLDTISLFAQVAVDWEQGISTGRISRRFHLGLIQGLADLASYFAKRTGVSEVALSGGVMQNMTLRVELPAALAQRGLRPLTHSLLPPNDGCISLGQAAWGRKRIAQL